MEVLAIAAIGGVVVYFYLTRSVGAPALQPPTYYQRQAGYIPGSLPPGANQAPAGNNTSALIIAGGTSAAIAGAMAYSAGQAGSDAGGAGAGLSPGAGAAVAAAGALIGTGLALWQQHVVRAQNATDENSAVTALVPAFHASLKAEFDGLNKGLINPTTALNDLETIRSSYWQQIAPYQTQTGQHTHPCTPIPSGGCDRGDGYGITTCNSTCTAGCCIGCDNIEPIICNAKQVIVNGGGSVRVVAFGASKYGFPGSAAYTLTYAPTVAA